VKISKDKAQEEHAEGVPSDAGMLEGVLSDAKEHTGGVLSDAKVHAGGAPSDAQRARWGCAERRAQRAMSFASSKILSFASSKILSFASSKILNFAASTI
jgi:hypothetical protein